MDFRKDKELSANAGPQGVVENRKFSRRGFLKGTSAAAVGVAVIPAVGLMSHSGSAYSASFDVLGMSTGNTLVRMARDIFPHDKVPDQIYASAIAAYDPLVAKDAQLKSLLMKGVARLNQEAMTLYGKPYVEIQSEGERVAVLYAIEQSAFFQKIRGDLIFSLYNNPDVWPIFGYEGSSWEKGGYLERGFNDIDWL